MGLHRDPAERFDRLLRVVLGAGVEEVPTTVAELQQRLKDFNPSGFPATTRLAASVIDGDDSEQDLLWAAALAEHVNTPALSAAVNASVRDQVHAEIRRRYHDHAPAIYDRIADSFNAAAATFTAAAAVVDPEAPAEAVINLPAKQQQVWRDAATAYTDLTRLLPALTAAAQLTGIAHDDDDQLPLAVDAGDCHRRRVWEAWEIEKREAKDARTAQAHQPFTTTSPPTRSRTGRWGALTALGATIRACPLDDFAPYRRPKPMVERMVNEPGGPRRIVVDPEDPDYTEPQPVRHQSPPFIRA